MTDLHILNGPDYAEQHRMFIKDLRRKVMKFEDMRDIAASVEEFNKQPIIKGVINWGETSAWIAPPGGMKSALLANIAVHAAAGLDWHGHKTKQRINVVYFALERADLVRRRLIAQATRLGLDPRKLNIMVVSEMIDLMNPVVVEKVSALIEAGLHFFDDPDKDEADEVYPPWVMGAGLIIFDTFAKLIAAGGGDEDKAKDQGKVFANLQRIKNEHFCHVALIGHTGKDESRGSRGSNAIVGDVDMLVTISGSDVKTATVIKANDAPEGPICSFKSEVFEFGVDEDGDPITVNIVSAEEVSAQSSPKGPSNRRLSPRHQLALDALAEVVINAGKPPAPSYGLPDSVRLVPIDRWKDELYSRAVLSNDDANPRAEFKRIQEGLVAKNRIGRRDGFVWLAA